jgi:uncharacterized protein (TIGR02147 family)
MPESTAQPLPEASSLLREELVARIQKNPAFSLRAFASSLKISPGYLSQVMNNRKVLSEEKAYLIVSRIPWGDEKKKLFINLVRWQGSKDIQFRDHLLKQIKKEAGAAHAYYDLKLDEFKLIADWYHGAILELTSIQNFSLHPKSLASRLGISTAEAYEAVQRLLRLGMLTEVDGQLQKSNHSYQIKDISSEAIRYYHTQNLNKARQALHDQPLEKREFFSTTTAINPAKLKKAKALIHKFSSEILDCLEEGSRESLYQLNVQLFQVDKTTGRKVSP